MLSNLQQIVLNMLSSALTGREYVYNGEELKIEELISECQEQGIQSLVLEQTMALCQNGNEKAKVLSLFGKQERIVHEILQAQDEVLKLVRANGFHPVILKGWAAAKYYPEPSSRTFGDVDVLFPKDEFYPALEMLLGSEYGYRDINARVDHHIPLKKNGVVIEPHIAVGGLPSAEKEKEYLEELFAEGLKNPVTENLNGYDIPSLPDFQNGLVLLLHIRGHMKGGLGLRQIADWMAYVQKHLDDDAYRSNWKEVLEKAGLEKLAKVSTALCVKYLGLEGNYTWCEGIDDQMLDAMMEYVFDQGNFGHKKRQSDLGAKKISRSNGFFGFMKQLNKSGVRNWSNRYKKVNPETKPVLRAFAWFYGLGHYIGELHKKGGLPYLFKSYSEARKRRKFFDSLGLYD